MNPAPNTSFPKIDDGGCGTLVAFACHSIRHGHQRDRRPLGLVACCGHYSSTLKTACCSSRHLPPRLRCRRYSDPALSEWCLALGLVTLGALLEDPGKYAALVPLSHQDSGLLQPNNGGHTALLANNGAFAPLGALLASGTRWLALYFTGFQFLSLGYGVVEKLTLPSLE